jgi:hypothetical protein
VHLHFEVREEKYSLNYWKKDNGKFISSIDPLTVLQEESNIPEWGREAWEWAIKNGINDGIGYNEPVTELQVMVFLKRYNDMKGGD